MYDIAIRDAKTEQIKKVYGPFKSKNTAVGWASANLFKSLNPETRSLATSALSKQRIGATVGAAVVQLRDVQGLTIGS